MKVTKLRLMAYGWLALSCLAGTTLGGETHPKLIAWKAALEGGRVVSFVSPVGPVDDLPRIIAGGKTLAIGVELPDASSPSVVFRLLEVTTVEGGEVLKQVEKFSVQPGAAYTTAREPRITFTVDKVLAKSAEAPAGFAAATTGPVTNDLIAWEVLDFPPHAFRVTGRGGELTRVERGGATVGIVARAEGQDRAHFRVFDIATHPGAGEILRQRDSFVLAAGDLRGVHGEPAFRLKLTSVTIRRE